MAISVVSNTTTGVQTSSTKTTRNTGEMGKDEFLKLLITQLKFQDPLNPTDDKEFIAQMAQFSSLEQMQNMNSSFTSMKAFSLMGKNITAAVKNGDTGESSSVSGMVSKVKINGGKAYVEVDGKDIDIDTIGEVTDTGSTKLTDYMSLIGKNVEGKVSDDQGGSIPVSGKVISINNIGSAKNVALDQVILENVDVVLPENAIIYKDDYMNFNENREITVQTTDSSGNKVNITGKLLDWIKADEGYHVKLGNIMVPVDTLTGIAE